MTCVSRSGSACTHSGGSPASGSSSNSSMPLSRSSSAVVWHDWRSSGASSTAQCCQSAWPASILAMSSTWLTKRLRRSVSATMMPMNCWRCSGASSGSSRISSDRVRIAVRGVRSSCVTADMNSSFIRSSPCSCSLAARSSAVARSSERDFCSSSCECRRSRLDSSKMSSTSATSSASACTTEATMACAEALPMAPASRVSTCCTSSASAGNCSMRATPRCCAYSAKPLPARSGPKMRSSSASKSASRACPRQNTGWVLAVRSNTSTNNSAWLVSCADGLRQSETSTYAPTLASRLQNTACVR